ncbi:MAG: MmgE/PrpD family protein, partial [Gammaproteobacteria bacterium]
MNATPEPISQQLAQFTCGLDFAQIPADVIEQAKLHILDALGIALAASRLDFARCTLDGLRVLSADGDVPVIGMSEKLPLRDAVLMNGTLIHGLDYDDTHSASIVHTSASATTTALFAGAARGCSGRDVLAAYLIAVEADARLGMAVKGDFHQVGLHPTGLLGTFGATLAAGRLMGLDSNQLRDAQGIALSLAGGSMEFLADGAWTKRMHPGWAGVCGITAAALAHGGFKGPGEPYEGRFGLYRMHLGEDAKVDWDACTAELGQRWEMRNVALKPYPACHFNHAFADATLALVREHGIGADDVVSIRALIGDGSVKTVCEPESRKRRPANAYEAQFSTHYTIATCLTRGRFTLDELEPECVNDPQTLELCDRIAYEVDPESAFPKYYSGAVVIQTKDGRTLSHREQINRGAAGNPLTPGEVKDKFRANAASAMNAGKTEET